MNAQLHSLLVTALLAALVRPVGDSVLEALMDTQKDLAFYIKDAQGRYVMVNETLRERSGHKLKRELLGRTVAEVFAGEAAQMSQLQDEQTLTGGRELHNLLECYISAGGCLVWCLTSKIPLVGAGGEVLGLVGLSRDLPAASQHPDFPRVALALRYIYDHFAEDVRLSDVAREVGLSPDTFERLSKRVTGLTPKQLLLRTRFEYAARLLRQSSVGISEVAHACGYSDHSAFSRKFRAMAGITPQAYRRLCLAASRAEAESQVVDS